MKKLLLQLCIACTTFSFAQTNTFPSTGAVGIGTLTPNAWFSGKVLEFKDDRPILRLSPNSEEGAATILFKGGYNNSAATADEFHLNYISSLTNPRIMLGSYKNGGQTIITFLGAGNVGIGVDLPTSKLAVNGDIRCKEVKVETANWPDYVFKENYSLKSLPALAQYLKQNKHLPDMPSAEEIAKDGQNLGEITAKLLKNIEELTLHLIEKDKEIQHIKSLLSKGEKLK
jgi:hypothetical protein